MNNRIAIAICLVLFGLLMFVVGYWVGFYTAVNWIVGKAKYFIQDGNIDWKEIAKGLIKYQQNLNVCYP